MHYDLTYRFNFDGECYIQETKYVGTFRMKEIRKIYFVISVNSFKLPRNMQR